MKLTDLFTSTVPEELATGLQFTEGPVWYPHGYLLFSDIPAAIIYKLEPGGAPEPWRRNSGHSNGLTLDRQGRLVACEHGNRRVSRTEADGTVQPLVTAYRGQRLNSPNDVVVRSDGTVYFTDPPYGIRPEEQELPWNGVFRIAPDGDLQVLLTDFERCNGLAFSPDEQVLYIADTWRQHIRAFDVAPDGNLYGARLFAEMHSDMEGGPDGMKVDEQGRLYVAGAGGIWVYTAAGELLGVLITPQRPANLAFGGADRQTLYVTARTSIYALRTTVPGMPVL
jgi:sugar lactone lactonase YvrE